MSAAVFLDTNILVYADDRFDSSRQRKAQELIRQAAGQRTGRLSMQVLTEYFAVATKKLGLDAALARRRVELYSRLDIVRLEPVDLSSAIDIHRLHHVSIWDALILRAALISGCRRLYTEDLQAGFRIENLEVVNPFL